MNYKRILKVIGYIIVSILLCYFAKILYENFGKLKAYEFTINYWYIIPILIITGVSMLVGVWAWKYFFDSVNEKATFGNLFRMNIMILMSRYVPGKFVVLGSAIASAHKYGISKIKTTLCFIFLIALNGFCALVLFGLCSLFYVAQFRQYLWVLCLLPLVIFLHPKIFMKGLNILLKIFRRPPVNDVNLSFKNIFIIFCTRLVGWLFQVLRFFYIIRLVYPLEYKYLQLLLMILTLSWIMSTLLVFLPGDFGIKEVIVTYALSVYMPIEIAMIVAILLRIILLILEVLIAILGFYFTRGKLKNENSVYNTKHKPICNG